MAGDIYAYLMLYYSAIKKNKILSFVITQMDLEGIMLHGILSEKDRYHVISHMESEKQRNKSKVVIIENRFWLPERREVE